MSRTYNSRDLPWRGNDLRPVGKTTVVSIVPDRWPLFDEGLSKIPAPVDIEAARLKLARKFNTRIPTPSREGRDSLTSQKRRPPE
jgi:hypothetical protein